MNTAILSRKVDSGGVDEARLKPALYKLRSTRFGPSTLADITKRKHDEYASKLLLKDIHPTAFSLPCSIHYHNQNFFLWSFFSAKKNTTVVQEKNHITLRAWLVLEFRCSMMTLHNRKFLPGFECVLVFLRLMHVLFSHFIPLEKILLDAQCRGRMV